MKTKQLLLTWPLLALSLMACKDTRYVYYDSDQKKLQMVYEFDEETGNMDGSYKEYSEEGNLKVEGVYKNGKKNGVFKEYDDYNGALKYETSYKDDKKNGIRKEYDSDSTLRFEINYKDDEMNGAYKEYYDGVLRVDAYYKDGKKEGIYKSFDGKGLPQYEISYKNDERDGTYKEFTDGKLHLEVSYKNGKFDGPFKEYDAAGTLRIEASYKNDKKDGVNKGFGENGTLRSEITYVDGHPEGPFSVYDGNGNLVSEGNAPSVPFECTEYGDGCKKLFTDPRDDQSYPVVTIGKKVWMASNMNYETYNSSCYNGDFWKCTEYGRLYPWEDARHACPRGWHLPSKEEFEELFNAVGEMRFVGAMLKSTGDWDEKGYGLDAFDFSAAPAGLREPDGKYDFVGRGAYFWSSTGIEGYEVSDRGIHYGKNAKAFYMFLGYDSDSGYLMDSRSKYSGFSVRCVKN